MPLGHKTATTTATTKHLLQTSLSLSLSLSLGGVEKTEALLLILRVLKKNLSSRLGPDLSLKEYGIFTHSTQKQHLKKKHLKKMR